MMLVVNEWNGRFGNNIIQIINSIEYCFQENLNEIYLPNHEFLKSKHIIINKIDNNNIIKKSGEFLYELHNRKLINLNAYKIKLYFNKYIKPILNLNNLNQKLNCLGINIRSGDIFFNCIHPNYIQPPFSFYKNIINQNNIEIKLFTEDLRNPCANKLNKDYNLNWQKSSFRSDLENLIRCKKMILANSTLSIFLILMNNNCEEIYLPEYVHYHFKDRQYDLKELINKKTTIIDLPNYIKPKEWKNTKEQHNIMLNYGI